MACEGLRTVRPQYWLTIDFLMFNISDSLRISAATSGSFFTQNT